MRLDELKEAMGEKGLTLSYDKELVSFVAEKSYSEKYGARNMARFIQTEIEDKIADRIVSDREGKLTGFFLSVQSGNIEIQIV